MGMESIHNDIVMDAIVQTTESCLLKTSSSPH
jgi:hypothetical protein